jgi:hypothetical protein
MPTPLPPLDGELRFDGVMRKGRAGDFGHIVRHMPEGAWLSRHDDGAWGCQPEIVSAEQETK